MNVEILAIPFYLIALGVDWYWTHKKNSSEYRFNDVICNLACGLGSNVANSVQFVFTYTAYDQTFNYFHTSVTNSFSTAQWILAFIAVDLGYYCYHRAGHRINFLWAGHIVHHQSEDFNLSVALRQTFTGAVFSIPFYIPLAFLGIPLYIFITCKGANLVYQFWVHNQRIHKLPNWFEFIFNTPSHHRVHHGINPQYLDKNYGGTFIIWDRVFGTFEPEKERVVYGTTDQLLSWNSIWAQIAYFVQLSKRSMTLPKLSEKIGVWFQPPEWKGSTEPKSTYSLSRTKFETNTNKTLFIIIFFVLALILGLLSTNGPQNVKIQFALGLVSLIFLFFIGHVQQNGKN